VSVRILHGNPQQGVEDRRRGPPIAVLDDQLVGTDVAQQRPIEALVSLRQDKQSALGPHQKRGAGSSLVQHGGLAEQPAELLRPPVAGDAAGHGAQARAIATRQHHGPSPLGRSSRSCFQGRHRALPPRPSNGWLTSHHGYRPRTLCASATRLIPDMRAATLRSVPSLRATAHTRSNDRVMISCKRAVISPSRQA